MKALLVRLALVVVLFFAVEALVFHTSIYSSVLEPSSTAGRLQTAVWNEQQREVLNGNQVVAVGDSRMGLRARISNQLSAETGYTFATISVPGTSPRCWYYMLREVDPNKERYAAVIIPVNRFDDEEWEDVTNRLVDVNYLAPLLRFSDVLEFSGSFGNLSSRLEAFRGSLLKGWTYRRDFQDLLVNHKWRMKLVRSNRQDSAQALYNFEWGTRDLKGLSVDWNTRRIHFPEASTDAERRVLEDVLLRDKAAPTGKLAAYRREWFGRIVQNYQGSRTRVIFMRLPRGPVVRPDYAEDPRSVIVELAAHPNVIVASEHLFDELELPEFFGDPIHLNGPGSERFSQILAKDVGRMLGAR